MANFIKFESQDIRIEKIENVPITKTEESHIESVSIEKLSKLQLEVLEDITRIRNSAEGNYSKSKEDKLLSLSTLKTYLLRFETKSKLVQKEQIVNRLIEIWEKFQRKNEDEIEEPIIKTSAASNKISKYDNFM